MKYLKISVYELAAFLIILFGILLRLVLIGMNWPITNSDEDTIGIMARHIAYRGEHPTFFYGQNYMGSLEAYLGAGFFHLFGSSVFSLRLGLILLFALFLLSTYLLASLLYSKPVGLLSIGLLSLGSSYVMERQLSAIGGYPETLAFGSLLFLFASWLAITYTPALPLRKQCWRLAVYLLWGLSAGLGLWSDLLIAPFVVCSGLLLLVCCWRELMRVFASITLVIGLVIGAAPLIAYNLHPAPGEDSLTKLLLLAHGGSSHLNYTAAYLMKEIGNTIQVSIPMMTGNPFCPVTELAFLGPSSPHSLPCTLSHAVWGSGYMLLFALAILLTLRGVWHAWRQYRISGNLSEDRQHLARSFARFFLLAAAVLALLLYIFSAAPIDWPGIHARYIIGLLIATPSVVWPLWAGIGNTAQRNKTSGKIRASVCTGILLLIGSMFLIGPILTFSQRVPIAQATDQQYQSLIHHLIQIGATHIYTDYWTCDKIAFMSQEQIICGVIDGNLQPSHNRDTRYYDSVSADPHAAYVYTPDGLMPTLTKKISGGKTTYKHYEFDGYIIYQPT